MTTSANPAADIISTPYKPVALYYEGADTVEYVRKDVPAVYERVDEFLTLIFDMKAREELVGFQLKGFRNFYLQDAGRARFGEDFLSLVGLLERAVTRLGDAAFEDGRKDAYEKAARMALQDSVELHDLPKVA